MRRTGLIILTLVLLAACATCVDATTHGYGKGVELVVAGKARSIILLGKNCTNVERHAGEELAKYVKQMSGAALPIVSGGWKAAGRARTVVLIGRPDTSRAVADLCTKSSIGLSASCPGLDGFIIKTGRTSRPNINYLLIGGSEDRGTLYGVYHLLEKMYHVGFFEDGEYVPKYQRLILPPLNIVERPRFSLREYGDYCSAVYTSQFWEWDRWKYALNYLAKKKLNLHWQVAGGWQAPEEYIRKKVREDYGFKQDFTKDELHAVGLTKKMFDYSRDTLGIMAYTPVELSFAWVDQAFVDKYPKCSYIDIVDYFLNSTGRIIDPNDPEFARYVSSFVRKSIEVFGTDHLYYIAPPGAESHKLVRDENLQRTIRQDMARNYLKSLRIADPQATWVVNGWGLNFGAWTKDYVKKMFDALPDDAVVGDDSWSQAIRKYERLDYFWGKKWVLSFIDAFAGDGYMHGGLRSSLGVMKDLVSDPRAKRCIGVQSIPEIITKNPLYYDFLFSIFWNPEKVSVDEFLKDYALRRYGGKSQPNMARTMKMLEESVYGDFIGIWTVYPMARLHQSEAINPSIMETCREAYAKRALYIPKLREATRIALSESHNQAGNKLYDNDLVDISRQYVAELANYHFYRLYDAFLDGNLAKLNSEAHCIEKCYDALETILSSSQQYWYKTVCEERTLAFRESGGDPLPSVKAPLELKVIRYSKDLARSYVSQDLYELVKYCYRPRNMAVIEKLREKLAAGDNEVDFTTELYPVYQKARKDWDNNDNTIITDEEVFKGTAAQAVTQAMKMLDNLSPAKPVVIRKTPIFENSDFEHGLRNWTTTGNAFGLWSRRDIGTIGNWAAGGDRLGEDAKATGTLRSRDFVVNGDTIQFYMAGYDADKATPESRMAVHPGRNRVELMDSKSNEVLCTAEETPQDMFFVRRWGVSKYRGRKVFIRATRENPSELFGWIAVDDFNYVTSTEPLPKEQPAPVRTEQFGGVRFDFKVAGRNAFIVMPRRLADQTSIVATPGAYGISVVTDKEPRPWIWYAPTFTGQLPDTSTHEWLFKQLLEKGFSICGIDIGESYGNDTGVAAYESFYNKVVGKYGLSPKPSLYAQSRGALMLYNWATRHPGQVRSIGCVYPVCDMRSWPGLGTASKAYGISEAQMQEKLSAHNPIELLAPLAQEKVPILHLHGDADKVVPMAENSGELARRYKALGGDIRLVVIKGKGHEIAPEFFQSQDMVDFFVMNTKK